MMQSIYKNKKWKNKNNLKWFLMKAINLLKIVKT